MNILFVVGGCLKQNSSANLCHLAYINGFLENDHRIDIISLSERDCPIDSSIVLPKIDKWYTFDGSLYSHMASRKNKHGAEKSVISAPNNSNNSRSRIKNRIVRKVKDILISFYGEYGLEMGWVKRASKFQSNKQYDLVISLATPAASHLLTAILSKKGRIESKYWCQIWEDPWQLDLYSTDNRNKKFKEEKKLVSLPDKVIYVSPITLQNQKRLYPESSEKMIWLPLPYYYKKQYGPTNNTKLQYGYYGDYHSHVRNLEPFYIAAQNTQINANIVGNPSGLFSETEKIKIQPRVGLRELEKLETKTDVLVFVCNLSGGQIPGKIYQYSATNKIILFVLDGTQSEKDQIREYFEKFNRYIFCENTVESIECAIHQIENGIISSINNEPIESFSPANIARSILENCK